MEFFIIGFPIVYSVHFSFCVTRQLGPCLQESPSWFIRKTSFGCRFSFWGCLVWCIRLLTRQQDHRSGNQSTTCSSVTVYGSKIQHAGALHLDKVNRSQLIIFPFQSRVEVFTGDIRQFPHLVSSADVVVMHNVFEFFAPPEVQRDLWLALRQLIKRGALILTSPSLDQALSTLDTNIQLDQWVELLSQPSNIASSSMDDDDDDDDDEESVPEMDLVHLYRVL